MLDLAPYSAHAATTKAKNIPKIIEPNLRSTPALVVGMPVALVNSRFNLVMPNALFHENDTPGMVVLFFFAIEEGL